jgi:Mn-dependent DtxR family transcriptional regulator
MQLKEKLTTNYYKVLELLYDSLTIVNGERVSVITQVEISKKMNLSTITINTIFKELKNDGLVEIDKSIGRYRLSSESIKIVEKMKKI